MSTETAETIVASWMERVWNRRDVRAIDDLLAEDGVTYGLGEPFQGREPWYEFHGAMCDAFPEMHFQVLSQFTSDDWLCSRIQGEMVLTGWLDRKPTRMGDRHIESQPVSTLDATEKHPATCPKYQSGTYRAVSAVHYGRVRRRAVRYGVALMSDVGMRRHDGEMK